MELNPELASPCGLYCGVCAILIAHRANNQKLKEKLAKLYQGGTPGKGALPGGASLTADDIQCEGCLSDHPFLFCRQCRIKSCTQARGYTGCHECADFPCAHIDAFPMAVGKQVILRCTAYRRELGDEKWIKDEEARYRCPQCGHQAFRGAMRCGQCKAELSLD